MKIAFAASRWPPIIESLGTDTEIVNYGQAMDRQPATIQ